MKTKHRKAARAKRRIIRNPLEFVMLGAAKLLATEQVELRAIYEGAFDRFRRGEHCDDQWPILADATNMAQSLAELGIASDERSVEVIATAQGALSAVLQRHQAGKSWTLYPAEIAAIDEALFVHRIQVDCCSRAEFNRAVDMTHHRCRQALFGNVPAGTVVLRGGIGTQTRTPSEAAARRVELDPAATLAEFSQTEAA